MLSYPISCFYHQHLLCSKVSTCWFCCFGVIYTPIVFLLLRINTFKLCAVVYVTCLLQRHKYFENWGKKDIQYGKETISGYRKRKQTKSWTIILVTTWLPMATLWDQPRPAFFPNGIRKILILCLNVLCIKSHLDNRTDHLCCIYP